ncbi:MAG: hypothetical protein K8F60_14915 [Melioribacteraceae bacterium]|jgi:antitoxin component YwqK of YwqJK toxin-antitoxin module|nr:hypothetical protein [Ignavibacteriota bacterium]MBZ0183749.1 hypothetical protein [Melioribacteraceae bacterium]
MIIYSISKRIKNFLKVKILNSTPNLNEQPSVVYRVNIGESPKKIKEGKVVYYYENGKIKAECNYKNYKLDGISNYYFQNGKIKAKEFYREGALEGLSKRYHDNGAVSCEEYYKKGILLFKRVFNLDGSVTTETQY